MRDCARLGMRGGSVGDSPSPPRRSRRLRRPWSVDTEGFAEQGSRRGSGAPAVPAAPAKAGGSAQALSGSGASTAEPHHKRLKKSPTPLACHQHSAPPCTNVRPTHPACSPCTPPCCSSASPACSASFCPCRRSGSSSGGRPLPPYRSAPSCRWSNRAAARRGAAGRPAAPAVRAPGGGAGGALGQLLPRNSGLHGGGRAAGVLHLPAVHHATGAVALGGRLRRLDLMTALLVLAGLVVMVPAFDPTNRVTRGACWGTLSGLTFAVLAVANRRLVRDEPPVRLALAQNAVAALVLLPLLFLRPGGAGTGGPRGTRDVLLLALLGVGCTALAHTLFIRGLARARAQSASVISGLGTGLRDPLRPAVPRRGARASHDRRRCGDTGRGRRGFRRPGDPRGPGADLSTQGGGTGGR